MFSFSWNESQEKEDIEEEIFYTPGNGTRSEQIVTLGGVLIELFSPPRFSSFFSRKTGKAGQTGNNSKLCKFNGGQNVWNA